MRINVYRLQLNHSFILSPGITVADSDLEQSFNKKQAKIKLKSVHNSVHMNNTDS